MKVKNVTLHNRYWSVYTLDMMIYVLKSWRKGKNWI